MSKWRTQPVQRCVAIFALVAALFHAGLAPQHLAMRAGATPTIAANAEDSSSNLASNKAWTVAIGGAICHGLGSPSDTPAQPDAPVPSAASCPVCTALSAAVALPAPADCAIAQRWSKPVIHRVVAQRVAEFLEQRSLNARGPPQAA